MKEKNKELLYALDISDELKESYELFFNDCSMSDDEVEYIIMSMAQVHQEGYAAGQHDTNYENNLS
jgi:hypothetical protein